MRNTQLHNHWVWVKYLIRSRKFAKERGEIMRCVLVHMPYP